MLAPDAVGEMIDFQNELIDHFELLLKPSPLDLAKEPALFFKRERWVQRSPSFLAVNLDEGSRLGAVARSALANQTFGVRDSERDAVFDFAEALGVVSPGMCRRLPPAVGSTATPALFQGRRIRCKPKTCAGDGQVCLE